MSFNSLNRVISLMLRVADMQNATDPVIPFEPQKPAPDISPPAVPLERRIPEEVGVSSEVIREYVSRLYSEKAAAQQTLLILRYGKVICEAGFRGYDTHIWKNLFSASKSVTAVAIGLLMDEHKIKATDKVVDILSGYVTPIVKMKLSSLTVKHLLTMRSSVMFSEPNSVTDEDWVKGFFNAPLKGKPGKTFAYNSLNSYMLSVIVREVSGESLTEYLRKRLFEPLGISEYFWERCPRGYEKGGWGLYMKPEDFAKIGILIQNGGLWEGRRILSARFISAAVKRQASVPEEYGGFDYGYQIWVGRKGNSFLFNGMTGQNLICFPESGIIVVSNAGNGDIFQQNEFFRITEEFFDRRFEGALPQDKAARSRLKRTLFSVMYPENKMPFDLRSVLDGKKYFTKEKHAASVGLYPVLLQAVQNNYSCGTRSIGFDIKDGKFFMIYEQSDETYCMELGFSKPVTTVISMHGEEYAVNAGGRFAFDEDGRRVFIMEIDFIEFPCKRIIKMFYDDDEVVFEFSETPGMVLCNNVLNVIFRALRSGFLSSAAISRLDPDFIKYKTERLFSPVLKGEEI